MNKVILMGRLTRDVEVKQSQSGTAYARVGIAVDRPFKKEETDFFNVVAFGKTAEFLGKWFAKGSKLLLEGRIQSSSYENKEGVKVNAVDVVAEQIEFADSKRKDEQKNSGFKDEYSREDPPF